MLFKYNSIIVTTRLNNLNKTKAFTLIELLVTVSIISVISSTILVSLNSARDKSKISAGVQLESSLYQNFGIDEVGIWNLDDNSGNITRNEKTSNNDPIVNPAGITLVPGVNGGQAFRFDGVTNAYVNFPDITTTYDRFTLSAWINPETGGDARQSILQNFWELVGNNICYFSYKMSPDGVTVVWRCSTGNLIAYNKWSHVVTSWDNSVIRHYVNGKLIWTSPIFDHGLGTSQSFLGIAGYAGRRFKGSIDNVRIYSKALDTAQIERLYAESIKDYEFVLHK